MRLRAEETTVLDLGASHVACAVFKRDRKHRLELTHLRIEELPLLSDSTESWNEEVQLALGRIAEGWQWSRDVIVALPPHIALTRFTRVPLVPPSKLNRVIEFEAAQVIPYPLVDVSWAAIEADTGPDGRDIMISAAKSDVLVSLCELLNQAGFVAQSVMPSCLATRYGFLHAYPEVSDPTLVTDVGARTTQLLFVHGQWFFTRALSFGGTSLSQSIADQLRIEVSVADALKREIPSASDVALSTSIPGGTVQAAISQFSQKLANEITRAMVHIERQSPTHRPRAIYLTGGGGLLDGLENHISDTLKVSVKRSDPVGQLSLMNGGAPMSETVGARLLTLVGLATHGRFRAEIAGDLMPTVLRRAINRRRSRPVWLSSAALATAALAAPALHFSQQARASTTLARQLEHQVTPLRELKARQADLQREIGEARTLFGSLQSVGDKRSSWMRFFVELQESMTAVEDVWLESLVILPDETRSPSRGSSKKDANSVVRLEVSGRLLDRANPTAKVSGESYERVKRLIANIDDSPFVAAIEGERFDNAQPGILKFEFILQLDPSHTL